MDKKKKKVLLICLAIITLLLFAYYDTPKMAPLGYETRNMTSYWKMRTDSIVAAYNFTKTKNGETYGMTLLRYSTISKAKEEYKYFHSLEDRGTLLCENIGVRLNKVYWGDEQAIRDYNIFYNVIDILIK